MADNSIGLSPPTPARVQFTVQPSASAPTVTTSKPYVAPGATLTVTGSGLLANESVAITFGSATLKTGKATPKGRLPSTAVHIPTNAQFGPTELVVTGKTSGLSTTVPEYITNSWTQYGGSSVQQATDPNDSVFRDHLGGQLLHIPQASLDLQRRRPHFRVQRSSPTATPSSPTTPARCTPSVRDRHGGVEAAPSRVASR